MTVVEVIATDAAFTWKCKYYNLLLLFIILPAMTGQSLSFVIILSGVRADCLAQQETTLQIYVPVVGVSRGYTDHYQGRGHSIRPTAPLINIHEHLI